MADKKTPKEASKLFESIMKASVSPKKVVKKDKPNSKPKASKKKPKK